MSNSIDPDKTKFRPYVSITQMKLMMGLINSYINNPANITKHSDKAAMLELYSVFSYTIMKSDCGLGKPAYVTAPRAIITDKNTKITGMFDDHEITPVSEGTSVSLPQAPLVIMSEKEMIESASEYEQDVIFLKETLDAGFITQEQYETKLAEFKVQHNIKE